MNKAMKVLQTWSTGNKPDFSSILKGTMQWYIYEIAWNNWMYIDQLQIQFDPLGPMEYHGVPVGLARLRIPQFGPEMVTDVTSNAETMYQGLCLFGSFRFW